MKTSQSTYNNKDGSTRFYYYTNGAAYRGTLVDDGGYGFELFVESRGYNVTDRYNQYILGYDPDGDGTQYEPVTQGFTYDDYKAEIDAGWPVMIHVKGHTMVGVGYDDETNLMYIHDTWDYDTHTMTWGGEYSGMQHMGVTIIYFDEQIPVELTAFAAISANGVVSLEWATQTETENLGFHVYRSIVEDDDYSKISTDLIQGAGSSDQAHSYSYTDEEVKTGNTYYYKLADVDFNGSVTFHGPISVTVEAVTPTKYMLEQSYPNPFNPETAINFSIKEAGKVSLKIYNLQGQLIRSLIDEEKLAGSYSIIWKGTNDQGVRVSSGTYLYTLKVNGFEATKKLVFMK